MRQGAGNAPEATIRRHVWLRMGVEWLLLAGVQGIAPEGVIWTVCRASLKCTPDKKKQMFHDVTFNLEYVPHI